jgi:hypothetical protein
VLRFQLPKKWLVIDVAVREEHKNSTVGKSTLYFNEIASLNDSRPF